MAQIGYFPGQPIIRAPKAGKAVPPQEYDFDVISKWIEQTFRDIDFGRLPGGVKDDIVRDIIRQLTVSAQPKRADYDVQRALEYGEINETPGVQLQLNINPQDWLNDPGKELDKVVSGWAKSTFNWDDVRNYVEKKYFWEPVLAGRTDLAPESSTGSSLGFAEDMAKKLMGIDPTRVNEPQPYQMTEMGVMKQLLRADGTPLNNQVTIGLGAPARPFGSKDRDIYEGVGQSFLDFINGADQSGTRNSSMHKLRSSTLEAVEEELSQTRAIRSAPNGSVHGSVLSDSAFEAVDNFTVGYNTLNAMKQMRAGPTGKAGLTLASKSLSSIVLEGVDDRRVDAAGLPIGNQRKGAVDLKGNPISVGDTLKKLWDSTETVVPGAVPKNSVGQALHTLATERSNLHTAAERARFDAATAEFQSKIKALQQLVETNLKKGKAIENQASAAFIKGRVDSLSKGFLDSNALAKGMEFRFGEVMQASLMQGRDPFGSRDLGSAIREAVEYRKATPGLRTGIENASRLLTAAAPIYDRNDLEDVLKNFQDGKIMQKYMWPRVRTYVESWTPAKWVGDRLAETHYFGLKYDADQMEANARRAGNYFSSAEDTSLLATDPKNVKYLANMDKAAAWCPKNTFRLDIAGVGKVKLEGGKHFEGAINYHKLLTAKETPGNKVLGRLQTNLDPKTGRILGFNDGGKDFLNVLNKGKNASAIVLISGPDDDIGLNRWLGNSDRFKAWLFANQKVLKLKFDAAGNLLEGGLEGQANAKIIASLIQQLGSRMGSTDYVSVLWERAGRLQILSSYANQLQTKVLTKVGKFVAPFLQLKNAISTAVSELFAKLISQGLAAASGGIAELIAPLVDKIIKPIIKFVTNLVLNRIENLGKAILHGDISGFMKDQEKLLTATTKSCLFFFGIPVLVIFFVAFAFFGTTLTTMPVVDPTRGAGFVVSGPGAAGGGIPISCEGPASEEDGNLSELSGASNLIAIKGLELVQGNNAEKTGLIRGFWCFWNHQMDYPNLWDEAQYQANPNPDPFYAGENGYNWMFWCTFLVNKAFERAGVDIGDIGGVRYMAMRFGNDGTLNSPSNLSGNGNPSLIYIANRDPDIKNYGIQAGDAVFIDTGGNSFGHVALVYSVNQDIIETIHSNSSLKRWSFTRDSVTGVVQSSEYFSIIGFGRVK